MIFNYMKLYLITILSIFIFIFFFSLQNNVLAQVNSSGLAISIPTKETDLTEGDIICSYQDGFVKCISEYDPSMYGVVTENPSASIEDSELTNSTLTLTTGVAVVRVTAKSGNIKDGDFITTSDVAGIGQKASRNGYVLGVAMEDYSPSDQNQISSIQLTINIHPAAGLTGPGSNLLQFIRKGLAVPLFEPLESLRYILAVIMVLIAFTLGMIYFGRSSRAGIEAIGRNPLAKRVIQFTVFMNIVLTIVIVIVGLAIAYLILIL